MTVDINTGPGRGEGEGEMPSNMRVEIRRRIHNGSNKTEQAEILAVYPNMTGHTLTPRVMLVASFLISPLCPI